MPGTWNKQEWIVGAAILVLVVGGGIWGWSHTIGIRADVEERTLWYASVEGLVKRIQTDALSPIQGFGQDVASPLFLLSGTRTIRYRVMPNALSSSIVREVKDPSVGGQPPPEVLVRSVKSFDIRIMEGRLEITVEKQSNDGYIKDRFVRAFEVPWDKELRKE